MTATTRLPLAARDLLGESPIWDSRRQVLYWVDIRGRRVHRWAPGVAEAAGGLRHFETPQEVASIALAREGTLLLALSDGFASLDLASGAVEPFAPVHHPKPQMRLNDGRTDREGRFVCGSMVLHRQDPDASVYRLDTDGSVATLFSGVAVSNATCFSPDGRTMYFADSLAGVVRAWHYAPDGTLSGERVFVDTRPDGSGPDGATVDADGCLWVALVRAQRVGRYSPEGRLLRTVDVPVPYPTCPCFGGPSLDVLFVTSIRDSGNLLRSDDPAAGALVEVRGLGARGIPEVPYGGSFAAA